MATAREHVRITQACGVATIVFDRPPLNIMHLEMLEELIDAIAEVQPEARVLVLRGNGETFSAGLDVAGFASPRVGALIDSFHGLFRRLLMADFPIVGAIHGHCLGAGLELASVCDFAIATEDAIFGQPEIDLGLFPPVATMILPRRIGIASANDLILTGRRVSAAEAWDMGLLFRVVPSERLEEEVDSLVGQLSEKSAPVLRLAKRAMYGKFRARFMEDLAELEALYQNELAGLDDAREGVAAFLEKRASRWKHR